MNPHTMYREQQVLSWTRIDMLLALYQGAIDRLETALVAVERGDHDAARLPLLRAQRIVTELLAGLDAQYGTIPQNLTQLYAHVLEAASRGTVPELQSAITVLRTVASGLEAIREPALELERSGTIPPAGCGQSLCRTA